MGNLINKKYKDYINNVSKSSMSISLELSLYIWSEVNKIKPKKILDLGSGYSSFILRYYQCISKHKVSVKSVDTSTHWLDKTKKFLQKNNLGTDDMYVLEDFKKLPKRKYDFILYDLDNTSKRHTRLKYVLSLLSKNGLLIIDDVHNTEYRNEVISIVSKSKKNITFIKDITIDEYGRYAAIV